MRQQQGLEEEMLDVLGGGGAAGVQCRHRTSQKNPGESGMSPAQGRAAPQGWDDEVGVSDEGLCSAVCFPHCSFPSTRMFGWYFSGRVFVREV